MTFMVYALEAPKKDTPAMKRPRASRPRVAPLGFSLVELVIVVVIIGIVASIAAVRLASAGQDSAESALKSTLSTMRRTIDMYAAEHLGDYPGARADGSGGAANTQDALISQMLKYSDPDGNVSDTPDVNHVYGPYLRRFPAISVGPNAGDSEVAIDTVNSPPLVTGGTEAWVYNPATGEIIANTDDPNRAGSKTFDEY